jgi:hypothetical protein
MAEGKVGGFSASSRLVNCAVMGCYGGMMAGMVTMPVAGT